MQWNYYNGVSINSEWDFIKIRYWPRDLAEALINGELKNRKRFRLVCYLIGNGMDPNHVLEWMEKILREQGRRRHMKHVRQLLNDIKAGKGAKWTYYDENRGRLDTIGEWEDPDKYRKQTDEFLRRMDERERAAERRMQEAREAANEARRREIKRKIQRIKDERAAAGLEPLWR